MASFDPHDLFVRAVLARGLKLLGRTDDGRYEVDVAGNVMTVNLDNVARVALRDDDPEAIERFVDATIASTQPLPLWPEARAGVRCSAEAFASVPPEVISDRVTEDLSRVIAWTDPDEARIRWLTMADLRDWRISPDELLAACDENMDRLLAATPLAVEDVAGTPLGMLETASPFKASLIFSPSFKDKVAVAVGWPVLVVIPCRDFLYAWPAADQAFAARLGHVVVREHQGSGYPLTTEVLRVDDAGIVAIGRFTPSAP